MGVRQRDLVILGVKVPNTRMKELFPDAFDEDDYCGADWIGKSKAIPVLGYRFTQEHKALAVICVMNDEHSYLGRLVAYQHDDSGEGLGETSVVALLEDFETNEKTMDVLAENGLLEEASNIDVFVFSHYR